MCILYDDTIFIFDIQYVKTNFGTRSVVLVLLLLLTVAHIRTGVYTDLNNYFVT